MVIQDFDRQDPEIKLSILGETIYFPVAQSIDVAYKMLISKGEAVGNSFATSFRVSYHQITIKGFEPLNQDPEPQLENFYKAIERFSEKQKFLFKGGNQGILTISIDTNNQGRKTLWKFFVSPFSIKLTTNSKQQIRSYEFIVIGSTEPIKENINLVGASVPSMAAPNTGSDRFPLPLTTGKFQL